MNPDTFVRFRSRFLLAMLAFAAACVAFVALGWGLTWWALVILTALNAAIMTWYILHHVRARAYVAEKRCLLCPDCTYDLSAHEPSGRCPECGRSYTFEQLQRDWAAHQAR